MPASLQSVVDRLRTTVSQFSIVQKTFAILLVAALALGGFALATNLSKPTLSPLFADVSTTDASAIVDILASENVKYELTDGGTTILVPQASLYPMRLQVAAAGLPASSDGDGYSLLDSVGMTSSEFQQQTTYTRAIEGELAKTISAINGVTDATVKLAMPKDTVFVDEKADPTASVFIKTKPGSALSGEQVESIIHLVSAGIEGMKPTDVSVIDADGQVLSTVGSGVGGGADSGKTTEYEAKVASAVQKMLDTVVGAGNAVVSVTAELNYDQTQRTSEEYSSTEGIPPSSSTTTKEQYTGGNGTTVGGVLGPDNIAVPDNGADNNGDYTNESATVNNPTNKVTEQTTTAPGSVRRQSVAVAVNATAAAAMSKADLEAMVTTAAGILEDRGDTVSVTEAAFDTSAKEAAQQAFEEAAAAEKAAQTQLLIKQGSIAGVILLIVIILAFVLRRRANARRDELDVDALRAPQSEPFDFESEDDEAIVPPLGGVDVKRAQIEELADDQPAEVANLLRGWLGNTTGGKN